MTTIEKMQTKLATANADVERCSAELQTRQDALDSLDVESPQWERGYLEQRRAEARLAKAVTARAIAEADLAAAERKAKEEQLASLLAAADIASAASDELKEYEALYAATIDLSDRFARKAAAALDAHSRAAELAQELGVTIPNRADLEPVLVDVQAKLRAQGKRHAMPVPMWLGAPSVR